jgi:hypothetical protein
MARAPCNGVAVYVAGGRQGVVVNVARGGQDVVEATV